MTNAENNNTTIKFIDEPCSYEACLTCHCTDCMTGQAARKRGRDGYAEVLEILASAVDV